MFYFKNELLFLKYCYVIQLVFAIPFDCCIIMIGSSLQIFHSAATHSSPYTILVRFDTTWIALQSDYLKSEKR